MRKKLSITIGIPALNEEANIALLLQALVSQECIGFELITICVISDASTDNTCEKARSISDKRIFVTENSERKGKTQILNDLFKSCKEDVLIILDADIKITDRHFIQKLISPIIKDARIGLVGAQIDSVTGKSFIEKTFALSHAFKNELYLKTNSVDSVYLCHGRARAFSHAFYSQLEIPQDVPEDSYAYFACKQKRFAFAYADEAIAQFRSPTNMADHLRQSTRFVAGKTALTKYFKKGYIDQSYKLDIKVGKTVFFKYLLLNPIKVVLYLCIAIYSFLFAHRHSVHHSKWKMATSSKRFS